MKKGQKVEEAVVVEVKQLGRKINPTSARQLRLKELEMKREAGVCKQGRPVVEGSARQLRLAELETKRVNGELKRGRPTSAESKRQQRIAELEMKAKLNGGVIPKGRPKTVKSEPSIGQDEQVEIEAIENIIE